MIHQWFCGSNRWLLHHNYTIFERALNDNETRSEPRGAAVAYKRKVPTASDKKNKEQPFFEAAPCSF